MERTLSENVDFTVQNDRYFLELLELGHNFWNKSLIMAFQEAFDLINYGFMIKVFTLAYQNKKIANRKRFY